MKEVVLHIGMHKTGTTSIQSTLQGFDNKSVRMARIGDVNHSIPLATIFSPNRHDYFIHKRVGRSASEIDELADDFKQQLESELSLDRQRLLISGEDISLLEEEGVQKLKEFLYQHVDRVRVMAYVRDPVGFASSAFQQYIRGGARKVTVPLANYRDRFGKFIDVFGHDAVEFIPFKRSTLIGDSVVSDFCHRVGLSDGEITERASNESVSGEVTRLVYLFNREGTQSMGSNELLQARLKLIHMLNSTFSGAGFKLPREMILQSLDNEDVAWMEKVSGLDLQDGAMRGSGCAHPVDEQLGTIDAATIEKLQEMVGHIEPACARSRDTVQLLNLLYHSLYFRERYGMDGKPKQPGKSGAGVTTAPNCSGGAGRRQSVLAQMSSSPNADRLRRLFSKAS